MSDMSGIFARAARSKISPWVLGSVAGAAALSLLSAGASANYVGESFLDIPGIASGTTGPNHRKWLRIEAHYWGNAEPAAKTVRQRVKRIEYFSGPRAPRDGANTLVIAIDKRSPQLRKVMEACASRRTLPELKFAEATNRVRPVQEIGERPTGMPEFFEYSLKDAQIADCPVVPDAPEQAVVIAFKDIDWLTAAPYREGMPVVLQPASLPLLQTNGATKFFVVTWFAQAHDVSPDQCSAYNKPPSEDDYYALVPPGEAAREREERKASGGVSYRDGQMELRGPHRLNAVRLPGIVKDPGMIEPTSKVAYGLDLDGNDGRGRAPAGICRHDNFTSPDGRTGIDNQLFRIQGCASGYRGKRGQIPLYANEQRRNGTRQTLIRIGGIDNERNDDSVDVTLLYSTDPMPKSADGKTFLADYTYRLAKAAEFTHYFQTVHGRIVDGVLITDPVAEMTPLDFAGNKTFHQAQLRLEFGADGTLKGLLGGYLDWRRVLASSSSSDTEYNHGLQVPAWYNAFKRYADGLKDPVTGQCNGISAAYEIEGVPAYLPPSQLQALISPKRGKEISAR